MAWVPLITALGSRLTTSAAPPILAPSAWQAGKNTLPELPFLAGAAAEAAAPLFDKVKVDMDGRR
jgi:hypothetical protein